MAAIRSRSLRIALSALAVTAALPAAAAAQRSSAVPPERGGIAAQLKGIWEPVNYGEDLELKSVFFVTPDVGWAAGRAGTIIKTVDGGARWTAQLGGDPKNAASDIKELQFVDQRHGFAVQTTGTGDHLLLRTVDGERWQASGTVPQYRGDYVFTSPTLGFASVDDGILRTQDAGRSWAKVMDCALKLNVGGLTRNVRCSVKRMHFPTAAVGYGLAASPETPGVFIARTADGGATWTIWNVLPDESASQGKVFFTGEQTGFICTYLGRLFSTADGGQSWQGVAGSNCGDTRGIRFADPETGWMAGTRKWAYTTDGGSRWSTRAMQFPAAVTEFSMPRRDRGYVVGEHGMVYRYRIVPVQYTAANAIDAPAVGVFTSPLDAQVQQLVADVRALAAPGGEGTPAAAGSPGGDGAAAGAAPALPMSGAPPSGTTRANGATSGARGANRLGQLQGLLDVIARSMPDFMARYRNLNLVFEATRTAAGMPSWIQTVKGGLTAFRSATDRNAAAAALAQVVSAADSLKQQTSVAFLQASFTGGPPSPLSPQPAAVTTTTASALPAASAGSAAATAPPSRTDSVKKKVTDAVKKKLGGILRFPP